MFVEYTVNAVGPEHRRPAAAARALERRGGHDVRVPSPGVRVGHLLGIRAIGVGADHGRRRQRPRLDEGGLVVAARHRRRRVRGGALARQPRRDLLRRRPAQPRQGRALGRLSGRGARRRPLAPRPRAGGCLVVRCFRRSILSSSKKKNNLKRLACPPHPRPAKTRSPPSRSHRTTVALVRAVGPTPWARSRYLPRFAVVPAASRARRRSNGWRRR